MPSKRCPSWNLAFVLVAAGWATAASSYRLFLDFNDSTAMGKQAYSNLPVGSIHGEVKASPDFPGTADLGASGRIRVPGFRSPTGAFTIEARFRLKGYGDEHSRFVADILNTATWDNGPSQGLAFRIGGSYLYPVLPSNAYASNAEWQASLAAFSHIERGAFAECFGEFVLARNDDSRNWKEVYTDRCVELDRWTHMAAVWDGKDMRIYLNGHEATDKWRIQGAGSTPVLAPEVDAFVGARTLGDYDGRHLNGGIDFVRVMDGAMSAADIHRSYRETFTPEMRESLCRGILLPEYPEPGQVCGKGTRFRVKILPHGGCTEADFVAALLAGDKVEVEFAKNAAFEEILLRLTVEDLSFELSEAQLAKLGEDVGAIFWRARIARGNALGKAAASENEWSPARGFIMHPTQPAGARPQLPRRTLLGPGAGFLSDDGTGRMPLLHDLSGKRVLLRLVPVSGGWRLAPGSLPPAGILLKR